MWAVSPNHQSLKPHYQGCRGDLAMTSVTPSIGLHGWLSWSSWLGRCPLPSSPLHVLPFHSCVRGWGGQTFPNEGGPSFGQGDVSSWALLREPPKKPHCQEKLKQQQWNKTKNQQTNRQRKTSQKHKTTARVCGQHWLRLLSWGKKLTGAMKNISNSIRSVGRWQKWGAQTLRTSACSLLSLRLHVVGESHVDSLILEASPLVLCVYSLDSSTQEISRWSSSLYSKCPSY